MASTGSASVTLDAFTTSASGTRTLPSILQTARVFDRPGRAYIYTTVRLRVRLMDEDGEDVNPSTVLFKTCSPSGVETTYTFQTDDEILRESTGHYRADIVPDETGRWHYRWETTGTGTVITVESDFLVQASKFYDDVETGYSS